MIPKFQVPDQVFRGFRIATMEQGDTPYGQLMDHVIGVSNGVILWVAPEADVPNFEAAQSIQGNQRWLTPGLIDCHTHLVYGGNRADEWEARLGGTSYEEIARAGGGILSSVRATREASLESLVASAQQRLACLMSEGVTTVEIKSGYGLDTQTELKMLQAARALPERLDVRVETTLLGAHAVPPEFRGRADEYVDLVCQEMIPQAGNLCSAVDAFCESIAFDVRQTTKVLETAKEHGLKIKVHAEQLSDLGMAAVAARMGAVSADHLEYLSPQDCAVLAEFGTVATLLPGAFYCLKETQKPPVKALLEHGVPIAIATDSNPGSSPVLSLLTMGHMACNFFGLTPEQSLTGMTRHAAQALGLNDKIGTVSSGKIADFAIWDVESPAEILYCLGGNRCVATFVNGIQRANDGGADTGMINEQ